MDHSKGVGRESSRTDIGHRRCERRACRDPASVDRRRVVRCFDCERRRTDRHGPLNLRRVSATHHDVGDNGNPDWRSHHRVSDLGRNFSLASLAASERSPLRQSAQQPLNTDDPLRGAS